MKLFTFLFVLFPLLGGGDASITDAIGSEAIFAQEIVLTMELSDGSEVERTYTVAELDRILSDDNTGIFPADVVTCTTVVAGEPNSDCARTQSTCALAVAATVDCLQDRNRENKAP